MNILASSMDYQTKPERERKFQASTMGYQGKICKTLKGQDRCYGYPLKKFSFYLWKRDDYIRLLQGKLSKDSVVCEFTLNDFEIHVYLIDLGIVSYLH